MKREVLFKGKSFDTNEWIEGFLTHNKVNGRAWIGNFAFCSYYHTEAHPETVCQFTGLLDKNGDKIFEGDKLKNNFGVYIVEFNDGCFWACNEAEEDNVPLYVHNEESKIIGNIHD